MEDDEIKFAKPSDWVPMSEPVDIGVLSKLGEEASELTKAIFRALAQGLDEADPVTGKINRNAIEEEIADVEALLFVAKEQFILNYRRINLRSESKINFINPWLDFLETLED